MHRVHLQVSLRTDANTRLLMKNSFKYSINTYWVTSIEAPDALWSEELPASHEEVQRFRARVHDGDVGQSFFTFSDAFEHFLNQWEAKVHLANRMPLPPYAVHAVMHMHAHRGARVHLAHACSHAYACAHVHTRHSLSREGLKTLPFSRA